MPLIDKYGRKITYLRISITDRCNLRCRYCMPVEGIKLIPHERIMRYEEIRDFVEVAVELGINKVRITGGEPLVRRGVVELVRMLAQIHRIEDLSMTTNGILLSKYAEELADAGLMRVNISLDTLDPERYHYITRVGNLNDVLEGIKAAENAGLSPIKINCVIDKSPNEPDAQMVKRFAEEHNYQVRFIPKMDIENGKFSIVIGGIGGNCPICNRIRLTSDGFVKPCLFSDMKFDARKLGYRRAIELAVENKPERGTISKSNKFYNIGG